MMDDPPDAFPDRFDAVVIGASGGIGKAVTELLEADPRVGVVHVCSRQPIAATGKRRAHRVDLMDESTLAEAAAASDGARLVFIATGVLHQGARGPEKSWRSLDPEWMADVMRINAFGPALAAKHFLPRMPRLGKSVFAAVSARVGSISDNRLGGWYGYRASKAALNMFMKSASVEFARTHRHGVVLSLHPGTVATGLSEPFQKGVPPEKLFQPTASATGMMTVIERASAADSGGFFSWDGSPIPY